MRGRKQRISLRRRRPGGLNAAGEAAEEWDFIATDIRAHIQPVSVSVAAALMQAVPGQTRTSTHFVALPKGTDVEVDDRLVDGSDNSYVVQRIEAWHTQVEAHVSITDIQ